ncbi:MAG: transketolase [Chlorobi bacterium]|nr:transketolase [Chlorobiota bacterium]
MDTTVNHERNINTIRLLAVDAVEAAQSGHPGLPLGVSPMAYVLWTRHMRFNPANPQWAGRDRFVLSAGHGSALLYSLLYLFGYPGMTLDQLKNFRQYGSLTPGHPEWHLTDGVEVTTGPLGQGIANAVGIALAERHLAATLNRDGAPVADFHTYVIVGDGDLMEGISSEASSLAGHLKLHRLIALYDDNHISIDGSTDLAFTEDVAARYRAYGWNVEEVGDGNDIEGIDAAITRCKSVTDRPSLIRVRTTIGYGSPHRAGTAEAHGTPLGPEETKLVKQRFGFDPDKSFVVYDDVREYFAGFTARGAELEKEYVAMLDEYRKNFPDIAPLYDQWVERRLPENWRDALPKFAVGDDMATRAASGKVLDAIVPKIPMMIGGSADLTPSNNTKFKGSEDLTPANYGGRYVRYGVREHGMGGVMNGMAVTGLIPYGGTFLCFSDYMRPAIRIAALSHYPTIFVFTHDSIGLGEDGPTHQPVEHYAALRAIPNLYFIRPADANETSFGWQIALENRDNPIAFALSRQKLPTLAGTDQGGALKGAYVLIDAEQPDIIIAATGSEVHVAVDAAKILVSHNVSPRIVSMPCWEIFEEQSEEYREEVFPFAVPVIGVEAGVEMGWQGYADGFVGMKRYGTSAPGEVAMDKFCFTAEHVADRAMGLLAEIVSFREVVQNRLESEMMEEMNDEQSAPDEA